MVIRLSRPSKLPRNCPPRVIRRCGDSPSWTRTRKWFIPEAFKLRFALEISTFSLEVISSITKCFLFPFWIENIWLKSFINDASRCILAVIDRKQRRANWPSWKVLITNFVCQLKFILLINQVVNNYYDSTETKSHFRHENNIIMLTNIWNGYQSLRKDSSLVKREAGRE